MILDYYKILGVSRNASLSEITKAYHAQSAIWHPDNFVNDSPDNVAFAKARYDEIEEAYKVLSDSSLREKYDTSFLQAILDSSESRETSRWGRWLIPACFALMMVLLPKTCDDIKSIGSIGSIGSKGSIGNDLYNPDKYELGTQFLKDSSSTPYKLNIPKIEIPSLENGYSSGSSYDRSGNYSSGRQNNQVFRATPDIKAPYKHDIPITLPQLQNYDFKEGNAGD